MKTMVQRDPSEAKRTSNEPPRVLAVEDEERISRLISTVLSSEGYKVITAADGSEALDAVEDAQPSVILLDLMMPGMDGWEFLRHLRERDIDIPVVVVSAVRDLHVEARRLGVADHLSKPFDVQDLVKKVERLQPPADQP
jgi:CheY-like chemotaxis protein